MKKSDIINKLHVISWVAKDILWNLQFMTAAKFMILPTIVFAVWMLIKDEYNRIENLAITSWISMNICWMLHEFPPHWPKEWSYIPMVPAIIFTTLFVIQIAEPYIKLLRRR